MNSFVEYSSNNSGGRWWLDRDDWVKLEKAGWLVRWAWLDFDYKDHNWQYDDDGLPILKPDSSIPLGGTWLGAVATQAFRPNTKTLLEAVDEWEQITGKCATDTGCRCCGPPHDFTLYENGEHVDSGPRVSHTASFDDE